MSVTHIAGNVLTVCGRVIQRCSLCGERLVDSLNTAGPIGPGGKAPKIGTWEVGRQIRIDPREGVTRSTLVEDTEQLAADTCFDLLEN